MPLAFFVLTQYRRVTDRRTDRQTDTLRSLLPALAWRRAGKNGCIQWLTVTGHGVTWGLNNPQSVTAARGWWSNVFHVLVYDPELVFLQLFCLNFSLEFNNFVRKYGMQEKWYTAHELHVVKCARPWHKDRYCHMNNVLACEFFNNYYTSLTCYYRNQNMK